MADKRTGLGRGLDALLPGRQGRTNVIPPAKGSHVGVPAPGGQGSENPRVSFANVGHPTSLENPVADKDALVGARLIAIDAIERNPYQTRGKIDEAALEELAASIREQGVLQPILVREVRSRLSALGSQPNPNLTAKDAEDAKGSQNQQQVPPSGRNDNFVVHYQLMAGERRWMAAQRAGLKVIPAVVKPASDEQAMEITIIENLQREDLNPMEQARAFERLSREFRLTQDQIAMKTGKERASVANFMRLLKLPAATQQHIEAGTLTLGHGKVLMMLQNEPAEMQERVATRAAESGMSVRELEELVMKLMGPPAAVQKQAAEMRDPNVRAAEEMIQRALGCKATIKDRDGKGKITLEYATLEDFDRIVETLGKQ